MTAKAKSATRAKPKGPLQSELEQAPPEREAEQQTGETPSEQTPSLTGAEPAAVSESDLERTGAEYDRAIQEYADYYRRQQGFYSAAGYGWADAGLSSAQGYPESQWAQQAPTSTDEEDLYLLEQAVTDFQESLPYIKSLKGSDKSRYLASWKEHLTEIARLGAELIARLQSGLTELSASNTEK